MVSDEALKKLQEQIAAWPMTQRFVVQQLIEDYSNIRKDLLAYKNTGLTPEKILPKDKADEVALKLMRLADLESLCSYTRLRELAEAGKDGRLVVLPCKVGGEVYSTLDDFGRLHRCRATDVFLNEKPHLNIVVLEPVDYKGSQYGASFGAFSKSVFLTREEAKKATGGDEGCLN